MNDRLRAAAVALIADISHRYPGEKLRCLFMQELDAALLSEPSPTEDTRRLDFFESVTQERGVSLLGSPPVKGSLKTEASYNFHQQGIGYVGAVSSVRTAIDIAMKAKGM